MAYGYLEAWIASKERPRSGIFGFGNARNETRAKKDLLLATFFCAVFALVPRYLLQNRMETLAMQATDLVQI